MLIVQLKYLVIHDAALDMQVRLVLPDLVTVF